METVATLIVLASIVVGLFGLINLVKPLGLLRVRRRRHAAAVVGGSVVAFFGGALMGAASQPGGLNAGIERAEKERDTRGGAAAAAKMPAVKETAPEGVTQIEFNAVWGSAKVVMERCDEPVRRAGEIVGTGDVYAAYPAVQRAEQECNRATRLMDNIRPPASAKGDVKRALIDAREACSTTTGIKSEAMRKLALVVNGDSRPSAFAEAKAELQRGQLSSLSCIAKFAAAAEAAGVTLPEFDNKEADPAA